MRQLVRVLATVVPALHRLLGGRPAEPAEPDDDQENVYPLW